MLHRKVCLTALITFLTTIWLSSTLNSLPLFNVLPSLAQSQDTRKAQAEKLREEAEFKVTFVNEPQNAIQPLQQALAIYREIGDPQNEEGTLYALGEAYFLLGNSSQAISYFQQSLTLYKELNDFSEKQGSIQNNIPVERLEILGHAYLRQGNYREALNYYQQELASNSNQRNTDSKDLTNLGNAYYFLGDYTKAIDYYRRSLPKETQPVITGDILTNLGAVLFASGNYVEAEKTLIAAIKQFEIDRTMLNPGEEYAVGIFDSQSRPYNLLQQLLIVQNRPNEALEISERGQSRTFLDLLALRSSPQAAAQSPANSPTIAQIQKIAKQQNATIVKYSISYNDKSSYAGIWKLSQELELFVWVIKASGEINFRQVALDPRQRQRSSRLTASLQNFGQERIEQLGFPVMIAILIIIIGSSIRLMFWRKRLGIALTFVAASLTGGLAFLIMINQPLLVSRGESGASPSPQPNSPLTELVYSAQQSIGVSNRGLSEIVKGKTSKNAQESLQQLHQLLIEPIADLLPTNPTAHVIFIPQSNLFNVPFPALQAPTGQYLIEKHTLLTAPSIQVLELTHKQRQRVLGATNEALVVGNPIIPKTMPVTNPEELPEPLNLDSLPAAEQEAQDIAVLLGTQPLIGNQATETTVVQQLPKAKFIHLATHGLLDDFSGGIGPGAMILTPSGKDDGFLTTGEISKLNLNAELVVLSACQTGLGRTSSDGVIGLSRSFFTAGVPSVMVSLWSVPDQPTAFLMTNFYKNLQQPDKAKALRLAMLTTMKQHPNPVDWAAFTLIGEAE